MDKISAFKAKVLESLEIVKDLEDGDQEQAASYLSEVLGVNVFQLKEKNAEATPSLKVQRDADVEDGEQPCGSKEVTPAPPPKRGRGRPPKNRTPAAATGAATPQLKSPRPETPASSYGLRGSIKPVRKPGFLLDEKYLATRGTPFNDKTSSTAPEPVVKIEPEDDFDEQQIMANTPVVRVARMSEEMLASSGKDTTDSDRADDVEEDIEDEDYEEEFVEKKKTGQKRGVKSIGGSTKKTKSDASGRPKTSSKTGSSWIEVPEFDPVAGSARKSSRLGQKVRKVFESKRSRKSIAHLTNKGSDTYVNEKLVSKNSGTEGRNEKPGLSPNVIKEQNTPTRITGFSIKVEKDQGSSVSWSSNKPGRPPMKKVGSPQYAYAMSSESEVDEEHDDEAYSASAAKSSDAECPSGDEIQKIKVQVIYPSTGPNPLPSKEVTISAKRNVTKTPDDVSDPDFIPDMVEASPKASISKVKKDPEYLSRKLPDKITSRAALKLWVSLLCPVCYEVQSSGYALEAHRKVHNDNISCPTCSRQFNSNKSYLRHSIAHFSDGDPLKCPLCAVDKFTDLSRLQKHVRTCVGEDGGQPVIVCPWCSMGVHHISHLHQHQEICNGIMPVKIDIPQPEMVNGLTRCDVCKRVVHPSFYGTHRFKHANQMLLNCRVCGRGFCSGSQRERHERKHPSFDEEKAKEDLMELIVAGIPPEADWPQQWTNDTNMGVLEYTQATQAKEGASQELVLMGEEMEEGQEEEDDENEGLRGTEAGSRERMPPDVVIPTMEEISEQVYHKLKESGKIDLSLVDWMTHFQTTGSKLCEICGKVFKTNSERKIHLMTHLNIRPFACTLCDKKFVTLQQMTRHRELHTAECNIKCSLCPKKFRTRLQMARHRQTHYFEKNPLECPVCHKFFRGPRILKLHQAIHKGGKFRQWQCDICSKWFHQQYVLAIHRNLVHKIEGPVEGEAEVVAEEGEGLEVEDRIREEVAKRRVKKNDDDAQKTEAVDTEGGVSTKTKQLTMPRKSYNLYMCNICDKKMASYSAMKVHLMQHNGIRPFQCPHCPDKTFITRQNLQKHILCCHEKTGSVACEICGRTVKEHYYDRHMEKHSRQGYRPVPCTECDMRFYDHRTLKRHMQIHTKVSPNLCDLCGQTLSNPYQLKMHKKRHLGQLDHICDICGRGFVNKTVLQQHQWVHTRDRPKPYVCQICSRAFCTRRVLNGHTKREHGIVLGRYVCNHCHQDFGNEKPSYIQHVAQCNHEKRLRERAGYPTIPTATAGAQLVEQIGTTISIPNAEGLIETEEATVVIATGDAIHMQGIEGAQVIEAQEIHHEALLAHLEHQQVGDHTQEIQIIQAQEEVVVEEEAPEEEAVQYVFVDADGNVLETIEGTAGDFVVKTEDVDGQEHVVTYTVAGKGDGGEEVFAPVTVLQE